MKAQSLACSLSLFLAGSVIAADDIGRFQLVTATVTLDGKPTASLFKIDTATGQVSRFVEMTVADLPNGKHLAASGFMRVNDDINAAIDEAKGMLPAAIRAGEARPAPIPLSPAVIRAIEAGKTPKP
jgi:hypothetical protein